MADPKKISLPELPAEVYSTSWTVCAVSIQVLEKEIWVFRGGEPVRFVRCSGDGAPPEDRIAHRDLPSHHCVSFKSGVQAERVDCFSV